MMNTPKRGRLLPTAHHPVDLSNEQKVPQRESVPTAQNPMNATVLNSPPPGFPTVDELRKIREKAMGTPPPSATSKQEKQTPSIIREELPAIKEDVFSPDFVDPDAHDLPLIELASPMPSKGISYPIGSKISYRPYVFGEIKKVSGSKTTFMELAKIILTGIKTSFPIGDLTFYDFLYLALLRKLSTIGDTTIIATHVCPNKKCQSSNSYEVKVGPKVCEIEFWDVDYPELPISVDLKLGEEEPTTYEFSPLTILQYLELERRNLHKDPVSKLAMQCKNVDFNTVRSRLYRAYGEESDVLAQIEDLLFHGVKPINVSCPNCGAINLLQLDGGGIIIRPFRTREEVAHDRIRFGKTPAHKSDTPS